MDLTGTFYTHTDIHLDVNVAPNEGLHALKMIPATLGGGLAPSRHTGVHAEHRGAALRGARCSWHSDRMKGQAGSKASYKPTGIPVAVRTDVDQGDGSELSSKPRHA